jgi:hypothetical protein
VLVRQGAVDAVVLLRHDVDPAALVSARESGVRPPTAHVVEHRDVFGDANRVVGRQHDAELADANALGLHGDEQVEEHGVVGHLEAFDVKMVLGEAHRVVAEVVAEPRLLRDLLEHPTVEFGAGAGHSLLDVGPRSGGGEVEHRDFHDAFSAVFLSASAIEDRKREIKGKRRGLVFRCARCV